MRDLATRESSFVAEYRLDPSSFDILSGMLEMDLRVDERMSQISTSSGAISTKSRLGSALIILAGGCVIHIIFYSHHVHYRINCGFRYFIHHIVYTGLIND